MGEAPQLPREMTDEKTRAVNEILLAASSQLPSPPYDVSTRKFVAF